MGEPIDDEVLPRDRQRVELGSKVKLRDLEAEFLKLTDPTGKSFSRVETLAEADGLLFVCPKCFAEHGQRAGTHSIICWFVGKVPDDVSPKPGRWTPQGTGIDDLSFVPSAGLSHSVLLTSGCNWHGFVTNGEAA
jgi:hypothetical protein